MSFIHLVQVGPVHSEDERLEIGAKMRRAL